MKNWLIWKDPDSGSDWGWEEKGMTEDDIWMASPTQWTWSWVSSGNWWWTGRPGVLQSMGLQRVRHDWATELYWPEVSKESTCQFKRHGFDSWVRKIPWRRKWQPAQNSCLENSMNSGAWWATVQEITPPPKKKERNTAWFLLKSLISFYFCLGSVTTAMHMSIFSPVQFLCILLLKERHVQVQAQQHAVKGSRSQSISLCLS